jgi:hypothetical protein
MLSIALNRTLEVFSRTGTPKNSGPAISEALTKVFDLDATFTEKYAAMDAVFEKYPEFTPMQEYIFDLLMVRFLSADSEGTDPEYFDSEEWLAIEEQTLDRGTELLNLLLYVKEAADVGAEISADDFLDEFLLTDDDTFQEEAVIYELLIDHKALIDAEPSAWPEIYLEAELDDPLKDLILPLFNIFSGALDQKEFEMMVTPLGEDADIMAACNCLLTTFAQYGNED